MARSRCQRRFRPLSCPRRRFLRPRTAGDRHEHFGDRSRARSYDARARRLHPNLRIAVNVDIVPVIYVSSRFLDSSSSVEVIDYTSVRGRTPVKLRVGAKPQVYSLPTWMWPDIEGHVDYAFNAYSFQEMEEDVCRNYSAQMLRLAQRGVMLHSSAAGHKPQAGGQKTPVTMEFLKALFHSRFPRTEEIPGIWTDSYDTHPNNTALLRA